MNLCSRALGLAALAGIVCVSPLFAQQTPPSTPSDMEAVYTVSIEKRTAQIFTDLGAIDPAKSNRVHDAVIAHYRALRARDEVLAAKLKDMPATAAGTDKDPRVQARSETQALHDKFLAQLAEDLSPQQIEIVKDKLTYGKVKFTYDGYCNIVPGLTDPEKAQILQSLKDAREEAMDGGSSGEKSAIFQKYKDKINGYLTAQGHDLAKAYADFNAKQDLANKQKPEAAVKPASVGQ